MILCVYLFKGRNNRHLHACYKQKTEACRRRQRGSPSPEGTCRGLLLPPPPHRRRRRRRHLAGGGGGVRHDAGGEGAATGLAGVAEGRSVDPPTAAGSAVAAAPSRRWVRAGVRACVAVSSGAIGTCSLSGGTPSPSRSRPATLAARPGADVGGVACGCGGDADARRSRCSCACSRRPYRTCSSRHGRDSGRESGRGSARGVAEGGNE